MDDIGIIGLAAAPWALAIAYVFGLATGWLVWGGRKAAAGEPASSAEAEAAKTHDALPGPGNADPCPPPMKLGALESEIRKAREYLAESDEEFESITRELSELDQTIKRANGRLKLVLRAVRRAGAGN